MAMEADGALALHVLVSRELDALPGRVSGDVIDLVTSNGAVYAAVTAPAAPGGFENRTGVVVRLRPR